MDIGTAKATVEEQALVPHHMIDLIDPDQEFSVAEFVDRAGPLIEDITARQKLPCVVGGPVCISRLWSEGWPNCRVAMMIAS